MPVLRRCATALPVAAYRELGSSLPFFATTLAEAEAEAGEIEAALATVNGAIAETERHGQRWFEAETHRVRGENFAQTRSDEHGAGRASPYYCHRYRATAEARSFELRATMVLAKLYINHMGAQLMRIAFWPVR
jgi:predicted ATPase